MYLEKLRSQNPLTICITNDVVKNFTANGLLALGASPAMSEYPEDLEDLLPYAKGLLINTGTLTNETWELYKSALDIAEKYGVPTVLDPVAAGAGAYRKKVALDLLHHHTISLVRGNAGEIAALIGESIETKGVTLVDEGIRSEFIAIVNYGIVGLIQLELGYAEAADMTNEEALVLYDKYAKTSLELMLAKNHDYDEAWRSMRISSYTDLILMKIYRTKQIESLSGETLVSEGIDANYMDMINYSVFGLIKIEFGD